MQHLMKNLLAMGITIGLADRNEFIKKVSGLIEEYQENPEKAEKWAQGLATYLEEVKEDIRLQRNITNSFSNDLPGKRNFEQLTKALHDLTNELQLKKQ